MKVGLVINRDKEEAKQAAQKVLSWFAEKGYPVFITREDAPYFAKGGIIMSRKKMSYEMDIILVLGGDGTFLSTARFFAGREIPILGFNIGRMGFLTEMDVGDLDMILADLLKGNFKVEERMMVQGAIYRKSKDQPIRVLGLNDVVVSKGAFARIIELTLRINGETITTYPGDGLIVATPTGSTAYSLSAGGPILNPALRSLVITPICPHTLYARSLVIQEEEEIEIEVERADRRVMLTIDGQEGIRLSKGDLIKLSAAEEKTFLARLMGTTFYQILGNRFNYKNAKGG